MSSQRRGNNRKGSRAFSVKRSKRSRPLKRTILIVGEGVTEHCYFDGIKREDVIAEHYAITVKKGKGKIPKEQVEQAIALKKEAARRKENYDKAICVLDTETPDCRQNMEDARVLARPKDIELILSNPSFEVWLLSHFLRTSRSFLNAADVEKELNTKWQRNFGLTYNKTDKSLYKHIASRTRDAINNAKAVQEQDHSDKPDILDCNSATEVYKLVEELLKLNEQAT